MSFNIRLLASLGSLLVLAALFSACSSQASEPVSGGGTRIPPARKTPPEAIETRQSVEPQPTPTPFPSQGTLPVSGEVPEVLLKAIMADLAASLGIDPSTIEVIKAESVVWGDGSLGCPEPGMMYTEALVNGYWVVLLAGDREYDYRASQKGYFRLCEGKGVGPVVGPSGEPVYSPDR
jgi:hypothetical protein